MPPNTPTRALRPVRNLVLGTHRTFSNSIKRRRPHVITVTDLPVEVRLKIWTYLIDKANSYFEVGASSNVFKPQTPQQPAFTKICRALRSETLGVFYQNLRLEINLRYKRTLPFLAQGLRTVGPALAFNLRHVYISTNLATGHWCRGHLRLDTHFKVDLSNDARSEDRVFVTFGNAACACRGVAADTKEMTRVCLDNGVRKMWEKRERDGLEVEDMVRLFEGFSRWCGGQGRCVDGKKRLI